MLEHQAPSRTRGRRAAHHLRRSLTRHSVRLRIETLEDRTVPNASLTLNANGSVVFIPDAITASNLTITSNNSTGAITFADAQINITVTDNSGGQLTSLGTGTGTVIVSPGLGSITALTAQGGNLAGAQLTVGASGLSLADAISLSQWDTLSVNAAISTTAVNQAITLDASATATSTLTVSAPVTTAGGTVTASATNGIAWAGIVNAGTGIVTFQNALTLTSTDTFAGSTVTFGGTVDSASAGGPFGLAVTGSGIFDAAVGANQPLFSLSVSGSAVLNGGAITTSSTETFAGATILGADTTLHASAVTFQAAIVGSAHVLTLSGATAGTFAGNATSLNSLFVGGSAQLNANISTTGSQTYSAAVTLGSNVTLNATTVTCNGSLVSGASGPFSLMVNGSAVLNAVGGAGNAVLTSLSVSGTCILNGNVATTGAQTYTAAAALGASLTLQGSTISFGSTLGSGAGGIYNFTVTGNAVFGGTIARIQNLSVSGTAALNGGAITTTAGQNFGGTVTLGVDTALHATNVTFAAAVASAGAGSFNLMITGNLATQAAIAGIASLSVSGTTIASGAITTAAGQTYAGATTLTANTSLTGSSLTLGGALAGGGHDLTLTFSQPVTISSTTFSGLRNLTVAAGGATTLSGTITVTGNETFNSPITLAASTALVANAVAFPGGITGAGFDLTATSSVPVAFNGTNVTGVYNLTINGPASVTGTLSTTGNQSFNGLATVAGTLSTTGNQTFTSSATVTGTLTAGGNQSFGGPASLAGSLTAGGSQMFGATVSVSGILTASGNQTFNGAVTLTGDTTLNPGTSNVSFNGSIDGHFNLTLSGTGTDTLAGAVGASQALASLTTAAGSTLVVGGGSLTTTGAQSYNGAVVLGANAMYSATGGNIAFAGTVNGAFTLTISAGLTSTPTPGFTQNNPNTVTFNGTIGGAAPLTGLSFSGTGSVTVMGNVNLGAGTLTVGGSNANVTFSGIISGSGNIVFAGSGSVTLTGNNTYTGATTLQAGSLTINGSQPSSAILIQGGTLSGTGITGSVQTTGGTLFPGISGVGNLAGSAVTIAGTYQAVLNGVTPGTQYDQLVVAGPLSLNGAVLNLALGFKPVPNDAFTLIKNNSGSPVLGTFQGLPEGAIVKVGSTWLRITYRGGSGQDVVVQPYALSYFAIASHGHVELRSTHDGSLMVDFQPFGPSYIDAISVALGDVNGDGYADLVVGAMAGNPEVCVYDGKALATGTFNPANPSGSLLIAFFAYGLNFNVGANVAVGYINNDGFADIVTGATAGNPDVHVYRGNDIAQGSFNPTGSSLLAQFFAYGLQFNVGANVAVGDVDGDGFADIVTGATVGNPDVHVYSGKDIAQGTFNPEGSSLLAQFFAYGLNFNVGATVAVADVVGDGFGQIITGASVGNPDVHVYSGQDVADGMSSPSLLDEFFAYQPDFNTGVAVSAEDFQGNGMPDILTGATAGSPHYRVISPTASGINPPALFEGIAGGLSGGITVGG